ncbi:D-alanyl-D-alanine carboxypeptidase [Streptomyces sp. PR69]|uniref:D-alanyl-D-alanine carboxypeptidase n=1 Tax=Streptomyces sp. PR69 TaxID=2984950 RepID=UPI002263DC23|nr:D-alanyl-D-alanine carboxypeptidase [Streptomyces sp. PR69]
MAGESPDKSEQHKPSGETASGERRPERGPERPERAPERDAARDPRLAVCRETPDEADERDAAGASEEPAADGKTDGKTGGNDERLRAAVAAWVSGEDGDKGVGEDGGEGSAPVEPEDAADDKAVDGKSVADKPVSAEANKGQPTDPPKDQPTAVFKAPRAPAVDQPTAALTMPPATPKPDAKPAPTPEPKPAAGPDREAGPAPAVGRASRFVPLRETAAPASKPADKPADKPDKPADEPADKPAAPDEPAAGPEAAAPASKPAAPTAPASLTEPERTKQQPLPPRPPLDLLAELTNTPPPAPTPLRTFARRIKIWSPLVLLLLIVFAVVQLVRPLPEPALGLSADREHTFAGGQLDMPWPDEGQGAVEVEGVGRIGTYGAQKPAPLASVTKTMTAYVILRDHPITGDETGPEIEIDQQAEDEADNVDESRAAVKKGQKYTQKQLLQLLMIPSANNVARLLARWDAGSEEAFIKKMNDAAKDLGMKDSVYTDPSGFKKSTVSTPQDQLKLAEAVMEFDVLREIVDMTILEVPGIDGKIYNSADRALLQPGVHGIKTGSSTPAGGNLLWAAYTEVDGEKRRILGVTMGTQKAAQLKQKLELAIDYSIALIKAAQKGVTSETLVKKGEVVGYVDDGLGGRTPVVAAEDLKAVGWPGLQTELDLVHGGKGIPGSAPAGTEVGELSVGSGTGKASVPVELQRDLAEPGLGAKLTRLG